MTVSAGKAEGANRFVSFFGRFPLPPLQAAKFFTSGVSALKTGQCACAKGFGGGWRRLPAPVHQGSAAACACATRRCGDRWLICMSPPRAVAAAGEEPEAAAVGAAPHAVGSG